MKRFGLLLAVLLMFLSVSGCGVGIIYTHTYQPLTLDMHKTTIVETEKSGAIKHLVLLYAPLSVAWDSAAIGDIAKKNGMNEIYFADLETFSVLHIWNEYTVHVYGK